MHTEELVEDSDGVDIGAGKILEQDDLDVAAGVGIGLLDSESDSYGLGVGSSVSISPCCCRFVFVLKSKSPLVYISAIARKIELIITIETFFNKKTKLWFPL